MEYLVNTSGEVSRFHNKTYAVKANSEQEAQEIARNKFQKEFDGINIDTEAQSYVRTKRAIVACILMGIAVVISFFSYKYTEFILFFIPNEKVFSMFPNMLSTIYAIVFYSVYVIRFKGIERSIGSTLDTMFTILSVLLLASVFSLILNADSLKLFWVIPLPSPNMVLIITIIASLLGVKLVSVGCMAFIAITAVSNVEIASKAMDVWGVVYVLCSFVGILLYISVEPAIIEAGPQIKRDFTNTFKAVKTEFSGAKSEAKTIIDKMSK